MKNNNKKGFTLIELLVVISIIGLLSSVVLASLSSARDKGTIAAGQVFDNHTYHALGSDAFLLFGFDDGSGTTVSDSSGNGNNGTISGTPSLDYSWTTGISGKAITLNSSGNPTYVSNSAPRGLTATNKYTISAWIKPTTILGTFQTILVLGNLSCTTFDGIVFSLEGNKINVDKWCNTITSTNGTITAGKWSHVAVSVNGTSVTFYQDGKIVGSSNSLNPASINQNKPMYIGYNVPGGGGNGRQFYGSIDELRVYNQPLASADIQSIYAEGLKSHSLANNK